jgi:hypothetical protein
VRTDEVLGYIGRHDWILPPKTSRRLHRHAYINPDEAFIALFIEVESVRRKAELTQCNLILSHLREHGSITPLEAMREYGIMRLGARVWDLKKQGYKISMSRESGLNRYGESTSYARYTLNPDGD